MEMDALYLIHANSGNCIIFKKYGNFEFNEDLIAGFLTALKDFSSEVTGGKGRMKNLDMGDYTIALLNESGLLIAAALNKRRDDESVVYRALRELLEAFMKEYKDVMPTWNGNLKIFKDFEPKIDKILKNGKVAEKEVFAAVLKKKLPKQLIEMGALTEAEFEFADYLNGVDPSDVIAEKHGIPLEKVEVMIEKFKNLGLIKLNKL
ncbi:MAG: hypothetical protein JW839_03550 [Candidatus Lokiarchaeota archaeon]|nr:hypothetical protein [Candidatus Lokiarchaeota archaeon]